MIYMAVDPGTTKSAFVIMNDRLIIGKGILENEQMLDVVRFPQHAGEACRHVEHFVCEMIASYGKPVGAEVFETVFWIGRFFEAFSKPSRHRIYRMDVKKNLCFSTSAKDAHIRQRLIDLYGGSSAIKKDGELHGVSKDVWAALAVATTWRDRVIAGLINI